MAKISIYKNNETNFTHNGIILKDTTECIVEEELNGKYLLELSYPVFGNDKHLLLKEENIIKADGQLFRIHSSIGSLGYIEVKARHIFYDLLHNFLEDVRPTDLNGTNALNWILDNTQYPHNFRGVSDVSTINTQYYIRKNPVESILGSDSLSTRWGGELVRDNFTIKLLRTRGANKGAQIAYGKNLMGLEVEKDMDSVATRIMPVGNDGLLLPEKYIDSPLIDNYNQPYIKKVEIDIGVEEATDDKEGITEEEAFDIMRQKVSDLYEFDKVDMPYVNIKADLALLENTEEYKHLKHLVKVELGDIVSCTDNPLNIEFEAKVIRVKKDVLSNKNVEVELGQFKKGLSDTIKDILEDVKQEIEINKSDLEKAIENATDLITSALGGYVIKREGEILIMDTEDPNTATRVWRWNLNGLGYSGTGVDGPFRLAMTMDGEIVADFITTGILNASLLKAGLIKPQRGDDFWNLENGHFKIGNMSQDENGWRVQIGENGETIEEEIEKVKNENKDYSDQEISDLKDYIENDFKIGALEDAYIENLKLVKRTLTSNKESINREYNATFNNVNLMLSLEKNDLRETFNTLSTHFVNVINTIDSILTDGEINNVTKGLLMDRLNIYTNYIPTYNNAYQAAIEYINLSTDDKIRVARERADSSLNLIDEFNDDKYWTPMEKNLIKFEIDSIKNEYPNLISQANEFDVPTNEYEAAYNELVNIFDNYILKLSDMDKTTYHAGGNSMARLTAYFDEKIKLLKAISSAIKVDINVAGASAERSEQRANDAQRKADDAFNKATNSQATITNMLDKTQIFPRDKLQIKKEWTTIQNEYSDLITLASQYGLSYTLRWALTNSYETLSGLMITVLEDMDTINGLNSVVVSYFQSYYQAQTDVLNEIAKVTKTDLDKKLATHDLRTELILELDRAKLQAKYIDLVGAVTVLSGIVKPNSQGKRDLGTLEAGLLHGPGMDINLTEGYINIDSASNRAGFTLRKMNSNGTVSHTIIDGNSNMFKIRSADTYTIGLGSTLNTRTYEIYHGLGYTPAFLAYQVDQPTATIPGGVALPAMSVGTREGSKDLSISTIIRASADSENIFIQMIRSTPGTIWRIKVQVFILEEKIF